MARPPKTGLDYFPLDVTFFDDDKIQLLNADFGSTGELVFIKLLCRIYKNGYYYPWGENEARILAKVMGGPATHTRVNAVVQGCLKVGLFNADMYKKHGILTSPAIQNRYAFICKQAKRRTHVEPRFDCRALENADTQATEQAPEFTPDKPGRNSVQTPQRKGKKTKTNQTKAKQTTPNQNIQNQTTTQQTTANEITLQQNTENETTPQPPLTILPTNNQILEPPEIKHRLLTAEYELTEFICKTYGFTTANFSLAVEIFIGEKTIAGNQLQKPYPDVLRQFTSWVKFHREKLLKQFEQHGITKAKPINQGIPFWRRQPA